jgi:hypothetical protein
MDAPEDALLPAPPSSPRLSREAA